MGQRLAQLAAKVQVLAVTHAPQVAARAGGHFRIAKAATEQGRRVATRVTTLGSAARQEEIARMLEVPVGTVWTRLHHARKALRAWDSAAES